MEKRMPSRRKSRAAKRRTFDVINPATGKALASYPITTAPQVRAKVEGARDAFRSWSRLDPKERAAYLLRFAEGLRKHKEAYAETMTLEMGKVIREAGLPAGVFQIVVGDRTTATALIHSPVSVVSLTGSVRTGVYVAREASKDLKKVVLELGGSDPFIVAGDADLDAAAKGAVAGRFVNGGQSCIAAKRFFVVDSAANEFVAKFAERMKRLRVGDPLDPTTDVGPLVSKTQRDEIESQVKDAIAKGAKVEVGGKRGRGEGWYFEPTLLSHVTKDMRVLREETFGPVAPVMAVPNLRAAIEEANDSEFGLGASLWTRNLGQTDELAAQVESGMVFINGVVKSDPRMPFGGVKHSGGGRELSRYGLLEMVNIKTVEIFPGHSGQTAIQKNTE